MSNVLMRYFSILMISLVGFAALANDNEWGTFDRLIVIQKFLDALYPSLKESSGLLLLRTESFHTAGGAMDEVDVILCRPGSGVPGGYVPGAPPPQRSCTGLYPAGPSDFLSIEVRFSPKYPIRHFFASGEFVLSLARPVLKEIADHSDWREEQRIDVLRRAGPRFGPENKKGLLRNIPVDSILQFTGCVIQPETAVLYASRDEAPPDPPVAGVAWRIAGKYNYEPKKSCSAIFEPFEGKLLAVTDMVPD